MNTVYLRIMTNRLMMPREICRLCVCKGFIPNYMELRDLYSLPNIVRVVKSRRMRWVGHVAHMVGGERCAQGSSGETRGKEGTGETQT